MSTSLPFATLDVFTHTRFAGNPLGIVRLPDGDANGKVDQATRQRIAREFNLSETIFIHPADPSSTAESGITVFPVSIHLTTAEIPFAGHPTVGCGWYILSHPHEFGIPHDTERVGLRTLAGDIVVSRREAEGGRTAVSLSVPTNFKIHPPFPSTQGVQGPSERVLKFQSKLLPSDIFQTGTSLSGAAPEFPIVSIVKGMTFLLLRLASPSALSKIQTTSEKDKLSAEYLGDWASFVGIYAYYLEDSVVEGGPQSQSGSDSVTRVRTRMVEGTLEDPATGSAASALAGYLATMAWQRASTSEAKSYAYHITQGVDMGRPSEIRVEARIDERGSVEKVLLSGEAVKVMEGTLAI